MLLPPPHMSWRDVLETIPEDKRPPVPQLLERDWRLAARREQIAPEGSWHIWLALAGRGWGKTRTGAEWIHEQKRLGFGRMALVAPTAADARDVLVEGESGILAVAPKHDRPIYQPTNRRITWPNGAMATLYSADEPDRLRGPQHEKAWCDEVAAWRYAQEAWDMLMFGLRIGGSPQAVATSTPRPIPLIKGLVKREGASVNITRGSTYDNIKNLAPNMVEEILALYEGTRLGRQEIHGEVLEDFDGALWTRDMITYIKKRPEADRTVIGVDPATSTGEKASHTGIVACSKKANRGFVLKDCSVKGSPEQWASAAVKAAYTHDADCIVAEKNQGGDMVEHTIRTIDDSIRVKLVHASKAKITRAEPIASLYERHRVDHIGAHPELEDEMCSFVPGEPSPDRFDAMVWAMTELFFGNQKRIRSFGRN